MLSRESAARELRADASASLAAHPGLAEQLKGRRIAVVGGTGFLGTWLAEAVAVLNDEFDASVALDLYGRNPGRWRNEYPHLAHPAISVQGADVRSPIELHRETRLVVFAAGIADPRVHASEPHRVFQTTVYGLDHTLGAAARLPAMERFVNVSSGLVLGAQLPAHPLTEDDVGALDFVRFHNLYAEVRRAAESLATAYAGQYRLPVSTLRAFTLLGPYQPVDAPFAVNNFIRDSLLSSEIRIHGQGQTRRGYLYGSDAAAWVLRALTAGADGQVYNMGNDEALSHEEVARTVASFIRPEPRLVLRSQPGAERRGHDFVPDISRARRELKVAPVFGARDAIGRTLRWHATRLGLQHLLK